MVETHPDVALLTPVPLEHLIDSLPVYEREGKVAFGSNAWELFDHQLEKLRQGTVVEVLIYASHPNERSAGNVASWAAKYVQYVHSVGGAHPEGMRFRSPVAEKEDSAKFWGGFWEAKQLRKLPSEEFVAISDLKGWTKQKHFKSNFVPEGPIIIERPAG